MITLTPRRLEVPREGRVAVVSDTHMPRMARDLPPSLRVALEGVDAILHAGDIVTADALARFEAIAPTIAVAGNNDEAALQSRLPDRALLEWCEFRLGLTHGHLSPGRSTPERALNAFRDEVVDAVVFGHSHTPMIERRGSVLLVNPGSPSDKRRQPLFSWAYLEIEGASLRAWHQFSDTKV